MLKSRKLHFLLLPVVMSPLHLSAVDAATVVQPDIRVAATYDMNGGLTNQPDIDTAGAGIDATLRMSVFNEVGSLTIAPKIRGYQYSDSQQPDREEYGLQVFWNRVFETAESDVLLLWDRQDLLSSELRDAPLDFDNPVDDGVEDSGIVDVESTRDRLYFNWDLDKQVNARNFVVIKLGHVDLDYDRSDGTSRVPFNESRADVGWRWRTSQISDVTLSVGGQQFESDEGLNVDAVRGDLEFYRGLSESFDFYAGVGYERSESDLGGVDLGDESNVTFRIGGQRFFPRTRILAEIVRDVRPNSSGIVSRETGATLGLRHQFTEKVTLHASVSAFTAEELGGSNSFADRDFLSGRIRLAWRITPRWSVEMDLSHSQQDFNSDVVLGGESEDRSRVLLGFRYVGLQTVPYKRRRR